MSIKVLRALAPWPAAAEWWADVSGVRQALELALEAEGDGRQR